MVAASSRSITLTVLALALPFLVAAYAVLLFYYHNIDELILSNLWAALGMALGAAAVVFLFVLVVLRRLAKAALAATVILLATLYYMPIMELARALSGRMPADAVGLTTVAVVALVLLFLVLHARGPLRLPVLLLGIFFAIQVGWVAITMGLYEARRAMTPAVPAAAYDGLAGLKLPEPPRSIFYVIFDRYAAASTLREVYGYDNAEFIDFLEAEGFRLPARSAANYLKTSHSLASTLNMTYLDYLADGRHVAAGDNAPVYTLLRDFRLARILKGLGYRYAHLGSWWGETQHNPHADFNLQRPGYGTFELHFQNRTVVAPLAGLLAGDGTPFMQRFCESNKAQFEQLIGLDYVQGPTFTFAHVLLPHPPYLIDADGRCLSDTEAAARSETENYIGQLRYVNAEIRRFVRAAKQLEPEPIIVLQSDEGPYPARYEDLTREHDWHDATPLELRQKTRILNAYYLPGVEAPPLPDRMTPVNTFRLLLNLYFGTQLKLYENRVLAYTSARDLYSFFDITDTVHADETPQK